MAPEGEILSLRCAGVWVSIPSHTCFSCLGSVGIGVKINQMSTVVLTVLARKYKHPVFQTSAHKVSLYLEAFFNELVRLYVRGRLFKIGSLKKDDCR